MREHSPRAERAIQYRVSRGVTTTPASSGAARAENYGRADSISDQNGNSAPCLVGATLQRAVSGRGVLQHQQELSLPGA